MNNPIDLNFVCTGCENTIVPSWDESDFCDYKSVLLGRCPYCDRPYKLTFIGEKLAEIRQGGKNDGAKNRGRPGS